jgi:anti-sigma factor ChrR (cupin superfamily)
VEQREEISAEAALFILEQLEPEASSRFEARLKDGCEIAQAEYAAFSEVATTLGMMVPPQEPPAGLRDRLMAQITAETPDQGRVLVRSNEGRWAPGPAPGVEIRLLYKKRTMLVRLAPGARLPVHHHPYAEQCLVLEGTVSDGETTVGPGDYVLMPAGSTHPELYSETGAIFLIAYS